MSAPPLPPQAPPPPLRFSRPVVLVGGGPFDWAAFAAARAHGEAVVCADGGVDRFDGDPEGAAGARPAAVIGDLDSARSLARWRAPGSGCAVVEIAEQDTTDFEKCLYATAAPAYLGVGFLGGRLDHALAALHAMLRRPEKRVVLIGEADAVCLAPPAWRCRVGAGRRVSVHPLARVRCRASRGLRWPLDRLELEIGRAVSASNEAAEDWVELSLEGPALLILPRAALPELLESLGLAQA